ncbi:MAG TPA: AAA family ATPase, partial [Rubrobacteraceae bacterium]|nr:AAA family ATPase [Rubrobacteraceae bacterium]
GGAAGKHNLPPGDRTSFIGREREVLEVKRLLAMTRLLTLTGAGGSGKTRLALKVARDLVGAYPEGVWLVELASLSEGELVPQAVASALGVREQPGRPLLETLEDALRATKALLVVDNCEHLIDAAARLTDALLSACPKLRILATSRESLGVEGETLWLVPPLSLPDPLRPPTTVEGAVGYEAVRLFLDRARSRLPAFKLTPQNTQAVVGICRTLDGIPLALELAAARMSALAVEQIAERLEDSLRLLSSGGSRTVEPRHRTMRAALKWSHDLLSEPERKLFGRLSVFAGGFTLEAAEAVGEGDGIERGEVLDLLCNLVEKSLVVAEANGDGGVRYRMLQPVRQYGQERLEESGEAEQARERHVRYYLKLVEDANLELMGEQQLTSLQQLELEEGNLRAALSWCLDTPSKGDAEMGLAMATALG